MTHIFNEPAKKLFAYLEQFFELSDAQKDQLLDKITYVSLKADEYLVKEGEVCTNLYIVHAGQLRSFFLDVNDNTKELVEVEVLSLRENDVCIPWESILGSKPSEESIQAVEPSELIYIRRSDMEKVLKENPKLVLSMMMQMVSAIVRSQKRMRARRRHGLDESED